MPLNRLYLPIYHYFAILMTDKGSSPFIHDLHNIQVFCRVVLKCVSFQNNI